MEKEKEENIWRRKIYFLRRKRKTEKEKEENMEMKIFFFAEEKKNGEGKGGKYLEKEKMTII